MSGLPEYDVADPALVRLPRERLRELQDERLQAMVAYVREASPFWREKLATVSDVRSVDDLPRLPLTTRAELQRDQEEHPPFGSYTCSPRERWARFFTTSGTSGRRLRRVFSARDWNLAVGRLARAPLARPGDLCLALAPIDGLMGPTASVDAWLRRGAVPVLAGLWGTEAKVRAIAELRPAVVSGTASYLVHVSEVAARVGVDLAGCGVRAIQSVGEPGAAVDTTRALIAERFGAETVADGYGMTELMPLGGSCPESRSLHVAADLVAMECVDPDSGAPVARGELGELVYTNLVSDTQPLLRYRSRDLGRLSDGSPCACGFTGDRIEVIEGRSDDMIWYRGVNVFPSAIEAVLRGRRELSAEYRIVVERGEGLPTLTVQAEVAAGPEGRIGAKVEGTDEAGTESGRVGTAGVGSGGAGGEPLRRALADELRAAIGVRAEVELLPPGSLAPAPPGAKARRVVDPSAPA